MDKIVIKNLILSGIHGATEKEHKNPQRFQIDLEIGYHQPMASATDNVADALDYRAARKIVKEIIAGPTINLLETIAEKIAARILAETEALTVTVSITKLDIWPDSQPGVVITRRRMP